MLFRPLALLGLAPFLAAAQQPTDREHELVDAYLRSSRPEFGGRGGGQVTLSPDGSTVAWEGLPIAGAGPNGLWLYPLPSGPARLVSAGGGEREMAWSPDGRTIAVLSGRGVDSQIFLIAASSGDSRRLTNFHGQVGRPVWSPNGTSVAFLAIENPKRISGATQPFRPQTGVVGSEPDVQRLGIVDVSSGQFHWASPPDMYVYEFGWAPDSREIAVTAARPPGENNWWTARLYAANMATGKLRPVANSEYQMNVPRWSPDGKSVAFIGGVMSDFGSIGGDVYVAPASGGEPRDLTPGWRASANWFEWTRSGAIIIGATERGGASLWRLDPASGNLKQLSWRAASFSGPEGRNSIAVSNDERVQAFGVSTPEHGPEIFAGPGGNTQITHWSDHASGRWGKVTQVSWTSDRFTVDGWLVAPQHVDRGKKYPMIVQVHGGPAAAVTAGWFLGQGAEFWSQAGYFVFMPNPRGSYGEGEAFTMANRKDFGYGDWRDIMAGVDKVLSTAPVDPDRLALTGGSYGGYMTMWGVTQTHRFKAAVAVAGIANWLSYYGENSIDQWMIPYFGATAYDDPKVYAKSSPITFIKHVATPTMVVVGEFDGECPPPQSYEFWHALNVLGVPTELVVYPGEGHGIRSPDNRRDLLARELAWFNYYLK